MDAAELLSIALRDLQRGFQNELESVSQEQFVQIPTPGANSIAFVTWHFARVEDDRIHRWVTGDTPIWEREAWPARLGVEPDASGMGFTDAQVATFQPDKADVLAYCERVWESVLDPVAALTPAALDHPPAGERPSMPLGRALANFVILHGGWHLGDVRFLKGLQGTPFGR